MLTAPHHESDETACRTVSVEEAARMLGIGRNTAYEAARTGELPTVRLGRRLVVPRARLLELLGEFPEGNGSEPPEPIADTTRAETAHGHGEG